MSDQTDEKAHQAAVRIFDQIESVKGMSKDNVWLGIYQTLLWVEEVPLLEIKYLPHIIDADKLRPPVGRKRNDGQASLVWQKRALDVGKYLSRQIGISNSDLPDKLGLLYKHPNWEGCQKQNPLGIGFVALVTHCLTNFMSTSWEFSTEKPAKSIFPDIKMTGRSKEPRIDILGSLNGIPRVIISCKWSLRHDRMGDVTTECTVYKSEALRNRMKLDYFLVTNEYDPSRLSKMIDDTCLDGLIHVHKPAVVEVCDLNGRLGGIIDLSEFFDIIRNLH